MHQSRSNNKCTKGKNEQGFAAIEFTMVLPFLLLLIFATAEFGRLLYQYNALNKTVRNASRYLAGNAKLGTGIYEIKQGIETKVITYIKYGSPNSVTPLLPNLTSSTIGLSLSGEFVTINVSYPWQPLFADMFTSFGLGSDMDISFPLISTYTMRAF
ncbi:MAG: TadE/TadG family type IV pilus assembly protein [Moritella sp.]|uniref:TadE/TadG family type IV pilus assembly protein n=1 Tax=Moritella sp. TaxID=78556 RepID=UPI0029B0FEC4|nr:TadE/TadG family type IV pilus assembly protein [Moritella sp.]MDX2321758.1 TadE/TadG family type IV pilus assembly protein [Moritella sp.]